VIVVLAPVDEDFSFAQLFAHFGNNLFGMFARQELGQAARHRFRLVEADGGVERHIKLQALGTGRFWKAFQWHALKKLSQPKGHIHTVQNVRWRTRIQIEDHHGGTLGLLAFGQQGVQFDVRKIRRPDERGQIVDQTIIDLIACSRGDRSRLHPVGTMTGTTLFVKERGIHPIRISFEDQRTIVQMRQKIRRDPDVIIDDLPLGETNRRIEHFVEIGDFKRATSDFQFRLRSHN
jgi:hypothetical protein